MFLIFWKYSLTEYSFQISQYYLNKDECMIVLGVSFSRVVYWRSVSYWASLGIPSYEDSEFALVVQAGTEEAH